MADGIPPWLQINPVEPVSRLLEGYRAGLSASEAQTAAAQRAQSMAIAQEQAAENARLRQEQHQLDVQRFGLELKLKEQQAEREAQEAAMQLEGQKGLEKDLSQGIPLQQAFVKWAPKLLYRHPERLAQSIHDLSPPGAPIFGTSPEGLPYAQNPRTGQVTFPSAASLRPEFEGGVEEYPGGVKAFRVSPQRLQVIGKPMQEGDLNAVQREQLKDIRAQEKEISKKLQEVPVQMRQKQPVYQAMEEELRALKARRDEVYRGRGAVPVKEQGDRDALIQKANDAIARGADPVQVKARLRALGIETN